MLFISSVIIEKYKIKAEDFPNAYIADQCSVSLPFSWDISDEQNYVITSVINVFSKMNLVVMSKNYFITGGAGFIANTIIRNLFTEEIKLLFMIHFIEILSKVNLITQYE